MLEHWKVAAGLLLFLAIVFALAEVCVRLDKRAREKRAKKRKAVSWRAPHMRLDDFVRNGGMDWNREPKQSIKVCSIDETSEAAG
jgi:hypothetical protein